jgi:hypothetical protein
VGLAELPVPTDALVLQIASTREDGRAVRMICKRA